MEEIEVGNKLVRDAVIDHLEGKGYKVTPAAGAQGVPKFSRVELVKDGTKQLCAIKVAANKWGRISFARNDNGTFTVLPDVDRVIIARPYPAENEVKVTMFDKATVLEAFGANYQALVDHGKEDLPSWVNPEPEEGWRMTGSGFIGDALWSEVIPLVASTSESNSEAEDPEVANTTGLLKALEKLLGSGFDITIKVRPAGTP